MTQKVLITGFGGQLSFYMVKYLLENTSHNLIVCARNSDKLPFLFRALAWNPRVVLVDLDLRDEQKIASLVIDGKPDYFINLAGRSFIPDSWTSPITTLDVNLKSLVYILEAVTKYAPNCRVFSAGSVEELEVKNIYAVSKKAAGDSCKVYRERYNIYTTHCQLGNSESPLRNESFVTRKITKGVTRIARAIENKKNFDPIFCGNIKNEVSWLHCEDTVDGIWRSLNQESYDKTLLGRDFPKNVKDYIICSNEFSSVKTFIELAFKEVNIHGIWIGKGAKEKFVLENYLNDFIDLKGQILVEIALQFYRPDNEVIKYNNRQIKEDLGFAPKFELKDIMKEMVAADLNP